MTSVEGMSSKQRSRKRKLHDMEQTGTSDSTDTSTSTITTTTKYRRLSATVTNNDANRASDLSSKAKSTTLTLPSSLNKSNKVKTCPYLDEVNRGTLDFDFEAVCSETMAAHNVYGCLVCGQYFAGRSVGSPAHFHSLDAGHHLFIDLTRVTVHCLPDDYEVTDSSLNDVKQNLRPTFTIRQVQNELDDPSKLEYIRTASAPVTTSVTSVAGKLGSDLSSGVDTATTLGGSKDFLCGLIGMNDLGHTDWFNAVFQCLMRITPLRNFFLFEENYISDTLCLNHDTDQLIQCFGALVRKYWNRHSFKGQVSPHEFLQAVSKASNRKFAIGKNADPLEFLSFLLRSFKERLPKKRPTIPVSHLRLKSSDRSRPFFTHVPSIFRGMIELETRISGNTKNKHEYAHTTDNSDVDMSGTAHSSDVTIESKPFFYLLLDLPEVPLFKDGESYIPQIALTELLNKFDGFTEETMIDNKTGSFKTVRYRLKKLPRYLIIAFRRFRENEFLTEKNPTIVNFHLKGLDLTHLLSPEECNESELMKLPLSKLKKKLCALYGLSKLPSKYESASKSDLCARIVKKFGKMDRCEWKGTRFDLVANLVNGGNEYRKGPNTAQVRYENNQGWYHIQDLYVEDCLAQVVAVSQSYFQVWRRL